MDMAHSLLKPHCLNIQDLFTTHITFFFLGRYERIWRKASGKSCFLNLHIKWNKLKVCAVSRRIGRNPSSLVCHSLYINFSINRGIMKTLRFCEKGAILCDQILSAKYKILGRLPFPCCSVDITAYQPCGLPSYQVTTIGILSNHLITGRKIDNNMGATLGKIHTWRKRSPKIFADFCCHSQFRQTLTGKNKIASKRNTLLPNRHICPHIFT